MVHPGHVKEDLSLTAGNEIFFSIIEHYTFKDCINF